MYRHYKRPLKPDIPLSQSVKFTVALYEQAYYTAKSGEKCYKFEIIFYIIVHLHKNHSAISGKDLMKRLLKNYTIKL